MLYISAQVRRRPMASKHFFSRLKLEETRDIICWYEQCNVARRIFSHALPLWFFPPGLDEHTGVNSNPDRRTNSKMAETRWQRDVTNKEKRRFPSFSSHLLLILVTSSQFPRAFSNRRPNLIQTWSSDIKYSLPNLISSIFVSICKQGYVCLYKLQEETVAEAFYVWMQTTRQGEHTNLKPRRWPLNVLCSSGMSKKMEIKHGQQSLEKINIRKSSQQ